MKSRWITHKGMRIFVSDFSNFGTDVGAMQHEAQGILEVLTKEPRNSVLSLALVEGTNANESTMGTLQELVAQTNPFIKARCIVGLRGFRKHLLAAFARLTGRAQFVIFETIDEAKDHLLQQA